MSEIVTIEWQKGKLSQETLIKLWDELKENESDKFNFLSFFEKHVMSFRFRKELKFHKSISTTR
jgi:hypothetical protein